MNKEDIKQNFKKRMNNMVEKYPDLKFNMSGHMLQNEIYKSDPVRYNVIRENNPVDKYNKYKEILSTIDSVHEGDILEFLRAHNLYHFVQKIQKIQKGNK